MMNKLKITKIGLTILSIAFLGSCKKDKTIQDVIPPDPVILKEFNRIRVLVNDKTTKEVHLITPYDGKIAKFEGQFPASNLYTSHSKRFAVSFNHTNNSVQLFDVGIVLHNDHTDILKYTGWSPINGTFSTPTHIFTKFDDIVVFNDGTGNFSISTEANIPSANSKFTEVKVAETIAHHGGIAKFKNGNFAITNIDDKATPKKTYVNIVDRTGKIQHKGTIMTTGIHGDESDGDIAIFGSYNGALVVKNNGEQFLIPNPADFGEKDMLGTIYYSDAAKKFFGRNSNKGLFEINVAEKKITPVLTSNNLAYATLDHSTNNFITLDKDGKIKIINCNTNQITKDEKIVDAFNPTVKSYDLKATKSFLYIVASDKNELEVRTIKDLKIAGTFKISANPNKIAILGFETDN